MLSIVPSHGNEHIALAIARKCPEDGNPAYGFFVDCALADILRSKRSNITELLSMPHKLSYNYRNNMLALNFDADF
jgi:hypothetical protein